MVGGPLYVGDVLPSILLLCDKCLTLAVINIRGLVFKPCAFLAFIGGLYMVSFVCMACSINLSRVKVNSMICMVRSVWVSWSHFVHMMHCVLCIQCRIVILRDNHVVCCYMSIIIFMVGWCCLVDYHVVCRR